ncbi:hypothetical protein F5B21DRAFT_504013 [Xylaria acuta]|nr:hypothetical protein F5B21DRAFT_504013 [Xylaria acuta]
MASRPPSPEAENQKLTHSIVIYFVLTPEAGAIQIPAILKGEHKDYSKTPIAVILGGAYDDAGIDVMMKASEGIKPIAWLRPDPTKPAPPAGS